jgi:hypothetical protein
MPEEKPAVEKTTQKKETKDKPTEVTKTEKKWHQALYVELSKPIPEELISTYETPDGKKLKTFPAQICIDRLNDNAGIDNWTIEDETLYEQAFKKGWAVAVRVTIIIEHDIKWAINKVGYGGAYSSNVGNAYKGALTSAIKNACKYLGIGREIYLEVPEEEEVTYEEVAEEDIVVPDGLQEIVSQIIDATTVEQLENLVPQLKDIKGEAVKTKIFEQFNKKKIELLEKK